MKWKLMTEWLIRRQDGYAIAKFKIGDQTLYRASFGGEFIGPPATKEEALTMCSQHMMQARQ